MLPGICLFVYHLFILFYLYFSAKNVRPGKAFCWDCFFCQECAAMPRLLPGIFAQEIAHFIVIIDNINAWQASLCEKSREFGKRHGNSGHGRSGQKRGSRARLSSAAV